MALPDEAYASIHYKNYLKINDLLNCQNLRSVELGHPAHDEMLFIVVHQVYELWFKQIIHEIESIGELFKIDHLDERDLSAIHNRLDRVCAIMRLINKQIPVLETMTPLDFLDFRNFLFPASGFQSFQFRKIEILLGLKSNNRITYNNKPYYTPFTENEQQELQQLEATGGLIEKVSQWLERTPFVEFNDFNFLNAYKEAVSTMIKNESEAISKSDYLSEGEKQMRLKMLGDTNTYFESIFDADKHQERVNEGGLRFSYKATLAALFIKLYRDEPILQMPNMILEKLVDIEELLTTWRFLHAQMVLRMLGKKVGTGGSSGHEYLNKTAEKHHIFHDLYNLSTMMIPRSELPPLPPHVKHSLGFNYVGKDKI